jgi:hypothetical protein
MVCIRTWKTYASTRLESMSRLEVHRGLLIDRMLFRDVIAAALLWRRRGFSTSLRDRRADEMALELAASVSIIAILCGLAASSGEQAMIKAQMVEAMNLATNHRIEVGEHLAVHGTPPGDGGLYEPSEIKGKYVSGIEWRDQEIVATMDSGFLPGVPAEARTVAFRFAVHPETGRWILLCGRAAAPPGYTAAAPSHTTLSSEYLPFSCRG